MEDRTPFLNQMFYAGKAAHRDGCPRKCPAEWRKDRLARQHWEGGWDAVLFEYAWNVGQQSPHNTLCPYTDRWMRRFWFMGWRSNHTLAVIHGDKKPASRSVDAKPGR